MSYSYRKKKSNHSKLTVKRFYRIFLFFSFNAYFIVILDLKSTKLKPQLLFICNCAQLIYSNLRLLDSKNITSILLLIHQGC